LDKPVSNPYPIYILSIRSPTLAVKVPFSQKVPLALKVPIEMEVPTPLILETLIGTRMFDMFD